MGGYSVLRWSKLVPVWVPVSGRFWSFSIVFPHTSYHLYSYARTNGTLAFISTYGKGGGPCWN